MTDPARAGATPAAANRVRRSLSLFALVLGIALAARARADVGSVEAPVIYGTDDRVDVYAESDPMLVELAIGSSAVLVPNVYVHTDGESYSLTRKSLGSQFRLCPDQLFYDQPTAAYCSGVLIDDDLLMTAGHCMTPPYTSDGKEQSFFCGAQHFVFNYYQSSPTDLAAIEANDVYTCRRIVVRHMDTSIDYSIVQLDRPVVGHTAPLIPPKDASIAAGTPITVIGAPSGLPLKITGGAFVTSPGPSGRPYFVGDPDTFGGNSGSGVYDDAYRLVGILVRGATDYRLREGTNCYEVNVLPPSKGQEEMTYVHRALDALCSSGYPSERLCGRSPACGDGFCTAGEETSCVGDCTGDVCGDGVCSDAEAHGSCPLDCNGAPNEVRLPQGACTAAPAPPEDSSGKGGAIASAIAALVALAVVRSRRRREDRDL